MNCETNDCQREKRGCKGCAYENMNNIDKDIENINKYIELVLDKNYCDCNELNVISTGSYCDGSKNVAQSMKNVLSELETYKKIAERYERECRMFRAFCRRIRKDEKRDVDEFNQGREYSYIQFLNLISGEQNWEYEGKYFDEVDKELLDWARKEVENGKNT